MQVRRNRRHAVWAIAVILVPVALGFALPYSGFYNVAAESRDKGATAWLLGTVMVRSVRRHAAGIRVPPLDDPSLVRTGFQHYREMCVGCHGAPGIPPAELAQGLNPTPPLLAESAGGWKPNELFWITKHGVRMTGMPAWGVTHSDDKIWAIVAFTRRLPKLTAAEYQALERQVPPLTMD